ncbi:IclR family transcriptional regulator domain-containing protein [Chelatococcus asaccharovorans]|uniref:IclR family transcriptional regulator n=1 Tax=Chelatococcus asaccharovorans TaxID=28210 RepID=A0A2V3U9C8_9HYPH|nr:IclR family transcriptional regulator C-terminal domain-containing protein [Chelatococcus asaccharovorans]MBS7705522.1 helix-turn-helix domain-containing protein [Chelatococcus asaccharovorans]PXW60073.1 IclR family transcriptional regulator [Chelatococcus asaccharovorans]CAH1656106.1 IclR family transcriptional regulator [Chelatococcus asaccharovorans]CAH1685219.1 IclR family transcriptional regulator [Chelatococcus asaccharovorans]
MNAIFPVKDCPTPSSGATLVADGAHSYAPVESVLRALEVLKHLNMLRVATVTELHKITGIAKPTVVRMLETLITAGYVTRDKAFGGYRITANVQNLSDGYFGAPMVIEAAHPYALELTQRIKWGVGVGMLEGQFMRLQFTTARYSPWAMPMTHLRMRLDLFTSAMGRAYLAFCPDYEREALIDAQLARITPSKRAESKRQIGRVIDDIRNQGYARKVRSREHSSTETISVAIRNDGLVLGCLALGYFRSAVPESEVAQRLAEPLQVTARAIEAEIAENYGNMTRMPTSQNRN